MLWLNNGAKMICKYFRKKQPKKPIELIPEILEDVILTPASEFKDLLTNEAGIHLIKLSEGYHKKNADGTCSPYLDPIGLPTIGYGTIKYSTGAKVTMNDKPLTKAQALYELKHEIDEKENVIDDFLKLKNITLNDNEFSALVSFSYNLGLGPITQSGRTMNHALRFGGKYEIANAFLVYNRAKTKKWGIRKLRVLKGLTIRRKAERALFLKPS